MTNYLAKIEYDTAGGGSDSDVESVSNNFRRLAEYLLDEGGRTLLKGITQTADGLNFGFAKDKPLTRDDTVWIVSHGSKNAGTLLGTNRWSYPGDKIAKSLSNSGGFPGKVVIVACFGWFVGKAIAASEGFGETEVTGWMGPVKTNAFGRVQLSTRLGADLGPVETNGRVKFKGRVITDVCGRGEMGDWVGVWDEVNEQRTAAAKVIQAAFRAFLAKTNE